MKAPCHVLFYPTNHSSYITTECTELIELMRNNKWLGVRLLKIKMKGRTGRCGWEAHGMSGSAGVCVCVHMHVCVHWHALFKWFQLRRCRQQEEINIAGSCFCMKNLLCMFGEEQSNGILLNKTADTTGPVSLKIIFSAKGSHIPCDNRYTITSNQSTF